MRQLRNDTTYPETARIAAEDWEAVVHRFNYSSMGVRFHRSGEALRKLVEELRAKQRAEDEARRREKQAKRAGGRAGGRRAGRALRRQHYAGRGRGRGGTTKW